MKSAVVLLSSGLDSTTNLYMTLEKGYSVPVVLTFDYGQKAASKEIEKSKHLTQKLGLKHEIIKLDFFQQFSTSSLINSGMQIPQKEQVDIESYEQSKKTASSVWVPNRNGIFLNIAAGFAELYKTDFIVPGFNLEEAQTFPDNSAEFAQRLSASFELSTQNKVKVLCWTLDMDKKRIAQEALRLGLDFHDLWPCYFSEEKPCGQCESCLRDKRAFASVLSEVSHYFSRSK